MMKKLFISADIEGTCGMANWNEAQKNHPDHEYFCQQMTLEVSAACLGASQSGFDSIFVKDAHDTSRNIDPRGLPENVELFRGRPEHPYRMMYGLDKSFDGVVFTGYHNAAQMHGNALGHTMNLDNNYIKINEEICSELMINCILAASLEIPVFAVTGDKLLCDWIASVNPNIHTVSTNEGYGNCARSIHPNVAVQRIRETVEKATAQDKRACMYPLPKSFLAEVNFKENPKTTRGSFYPGVVQKDARTLQFESADYFEVLRFFHFVL
jgi:D-amino peptidase